MLGKRKLLEDLSTVEHFKLLGKRKLVKDLSAVEHSHVKKKWRLAKRKSRKKEKEIPLDIVTMVTVKKEERY